jgi:hypothetical protein
VGVTLAPAHQLLVDQFTEQPAGRGHRKFRRAQALLLLPALIVALLVVALHVEVSAVAPLLTATSIMTGLTFTMALRFWERSVDARRDPFLATDGERLALLDDMRTHLVWTVLVGVISTAWLALMVLFADTAPPKWLSVGPTLGAVGASALVIYLVTLVGGVLVQFYTAGYALRH